MSDTTVDTTHTSASYRRDVGGLRGIAVLSVMLYHVNKLLLPGGFLGVDVFFVVSGFLITRNILQDIDGRRFSLAEFYRRRVKRIAPAMLVVVGVTLTASQLLLLPDDVRATAKSAVFSLASLANVYFWRYQDTSYFATDSAQVPLLHMWSLGVEEQFYLLWPALLMVSYRPARSRAKFAAAMVLAAAISFAMGDILYNRDPSFVYYMLPSRAGELLVGALVAVAVLGQVERRIAPATVPLGATVGALLLTASLLFITERQPFPGWRAVAPSAGTAMLILAGHCRENLWSRLLTSRVLVWIGLISYSAYLWHWPLLAFFRYAYGSPGPIAAAGALTMTLILGWLTYRYVEQPARRTSAPALQVITRQYALPAGVLIALALIIIYPERFGVSFHSASYWTELDVLRRQTPRPAYESDWVCQRQRITQDDARNPRCVLGGGDSLRAPQAILWGDSHAAHYIGLVEAVALRAGFRFRNIEIGSCPPLYADPTPFVESRRVADCRASLELVRPVVQQFPVVIVSAQWLGKPKGFLAAFFETARALAGEGKLVIVLGEAPWVRGYDRRCQQKALTYPLLRCSHLAMPLSSEIADVNGALRQFSEHTANVRYFDATAYLCPGGLCAASSPSGEPRYFDEAHLTLAASTALGREIILKEGVPDAFRLVAHWTAN